MKHSFFSNHFCLLFLFLGNVGLVAGQSVSILQKPIVNQMQLTNVWTIYLENHTQVTIEGKLHVKVSDVGGGLIYEGEREIILQPGHNSTDLSGITDIRHLYGKLPTSAHEPLVTEAGVYEVCCKFVSFKESANSCTVANLMGMQPLMLIIPTDKSESEEKYPVFTWIPPSLSAISEQQNYQLKVVEVYPEQNPTEAIAINMPLLQADNLIQTAYPYPLSSKNLEPAHTYAWQVTVGTGNLAESRSDVWTFSIKEDEKKVIEVVQDQPFVELTGSNSIYKAEGKVRFKFSGGAYTDMGPIVRLLNMKEEKIDLKAEWLLAKGQNLYELQIPAEAKVKNGEIYKLEIENPNNQNIETIFVEYSNRRNKAAGRKE